MILAELDPSSPAIVVAGVGGVPVDLSIDRHQTHVTFPSAGFITLPFLDKSVFRGTDVSVHRRVEMERHLTRTGLFEDVMLKPGAPGWLPVYFVLHYTGREYDGWLYYPNPYGES